MSVDTDPLRKLDENENIRLGIAAGAIDAVLTQPLQYWKNAFQQGLPFTMNPKLLCRGTGASVCNMGTTTGFQFVTSGFYQKLITGGADQKMSYGQEVAAASLGGASSGPICAFLELVMIQQQRFGGNLLGTPLRLVREHGASSLLRGCVPTIGREGIYCAGYLGIVPVTQRFFTEQYGLNPNYGNFLGAVSGGLVCVAISQPLDTAKTCMQGDVEKKKYKSLTHTLQTLIKEYGSVKAIYRGYWWRSAYVICEFLILDNVKKRLAPIMYPDKCGSR